MCMGILNDIKKSILLKFFTVIAFTLIVSLGICSIEAASYEIDDYKINAIVKENGDMHVEEYLKYSFSDDMNGLYRDILYKYNYKNQKDDISATSSRYQASGISNIGVYVSDTDFNSLKQSSLVDELQASNGMSDIFSITDKVENGYRKNIKVYSPVKSENCKYVKYVYDLDDVAVKYNDKGEIYWNFIGGDWECDISNLEIQIKFENELNHEENIQLYPHSYTDFLESKIENNTIYIYSKNIESGTALDARVIFPQEFLISATKNYNEVYDIEKLNKEEQEMSFGRKRYLLSNSISIYLFIGGIFGIIVIIIETNKIVNKGKKKGKQIEIFTDILENNTLGEYSTMLNMYQGYSNKNLLIATILDLVNRKYILMDAQKKLKKSFGKTSEYDYYMKLNNEKDYSSLNEYEINIINLLFNESLGKVTTISKFKNTNIELNGTLKEISKDYGFKINYGELVEELGKKEIDKIYDAVPKKLIIGVASYVLIYLLLIILNIMVISPAVSTISIIFSFFSFALGIIAAVFIASAKSMKNEYIDEYNKLIGLKKYLKEYSTLKERFPIEMALWGKYLVFASLFGIADKVSKEFKEELIAKGYDDDYIFITYPMLNMSMHTPQIYNSFEISTGSSSSGGFSGSGSGGGGGRWRRWRCLLRIKNIY